MTITEPTPAPSEHAGRLRSAFMNDCIRVPLTHLMPLKGMRPTVKQTHKYQQILASVREVGLVEPPAVAPVPKNAGHYFLLDGHLRVEALRDIGEVDVDCLVATDDDTYTYNKHINRLSAVQDHKMIVRAMEQGVPAERLGSSLGVSPETIRHRFRMLNGICDDVIALLVDTPCPAKTFEMLRRMKPVRQIEAAELMVEQRNYSVMFANALLAATAASQLVDHRKVTSSEPVSVTSIARMERELAALQIQTKVVEDAYGPDVLHLTIMRSYLAALLANAPVVKWLAKHQPDYLHEFQGITEMTDLKVETGRKSSK